MTANGEKQIYGDYEDLKSLKTAITWIGKYPSYYEDKTFEIKKIKVVIVENSMTEEEISSIIGIANKKGVPLTI
jgi:hypothetical protein